MARYTATLETPQPIAETFDYLSDFSTNAEWDPNTTHAERVDDGAVGLGSKFKLQARFLGSESELVYEITDFDPPRQVVLRGENAAVVSLDAMTFVPAADGGTRMTYDATLTFKGPLRLADPVLAVVFRRIGDRALEGLRTTLGSSTRRVSLAHR